MLKVIFGAEYEKYYETGKDGKVTKPELDPLCHRMRIAHFLEEYEYSLPPAPTRPISAHPSQLEIAAFAMAKADRIEKTKNHIFG